ncbi:TPA: eae-like domain protein [Salmonella enterica subsp. enterica serovar Waycross]
MTSREKFESWYLENWGHTEDDHETLFERDTDSTEGYYRLGVRLAHEAWQAAELASQQKLTDMAVQLANSDSRCRELAEFKSSVYAQLGAGCEAPEFAITEGLNNLRRFADTLHAIEREFFTKEVPDEECEGETVEECQLCWGMTVEQYVSEFGKCLVEVRAQGVDLVCDYHKSRCEALFDVDRKGSQRHGAALCDAIDIAAQLRKGAAL